MMNDIIEEETTKFENLLSFYSMRENDSIEKVADKYLNLIAFLTEEQIYFERCGKYRFSTFTEVENYYKDSAYMDSYTIGLGLSTYLWHVHRQVMRLFNNMLNTCNLAGGGG
jgi:hypothetical protein